MKFNKESITPGLVSSILLCPVIGVYIGVSLLCGPTPKQSIECRVTQVDKSQRQPNIFDRKQDIIYVTSAGREYVFYRREPRLTFDSLSVGDSANITFIDTKTVMELEANTPYKVFSDREREIITSTNGVIESYTKR